MKYIVIVVVIEENRPQDRTLRDATGTFDSFTESDCMLLRG